LPLGWHAWRNIKEDNWQYEKEKSILEYKKREEK
jgi:hypothetical protein